MNYQETLDYLYGALPMYQRIGAAAYRADLKNALELDAFFNQPHRSFKTIHVAGTNGKGSVSHMLASVLQESGYKTGLYTSPHLMDFRERIRLNGMPVSEEFVVGFTEKYRHVFEKLQTSFFEMTVFMAFEYYREEEVDIAVIETGMGGRLDTTNIIRPVLSVVTNIGLDHTRFLGNTPEEIAREKAGIIKDGVPVVVGESGQDTRHVFVEKAKECSSPLVFADEMAQVEYTLRNTDRTLSYRLQHSLPFGLSRIDCDLQGLYQQKNLVTAMVSLAELKKSGMKIAESSVAGGFRKIIRNTGLLGRWQEIGYNPLVVCDVAHNAEGFREVVAQISTIPFKKLYMILGFVNDKPLDEILALLPREAEFLLVEPDIPRAMGNEEAENRFREAGLRAETCGSIGEALQKAASPATADDLIFIGGSTFLVADLLTWKKSNNSF